MTNITIKALASGSSGNAYYISDSKTNLLIEAGIPIAKIKKALSYKLSSVNACIISHLHLDHCKAASGILKAGIPIFLPRETAISLNLSGHSINIIKAGRQFRIGSWTVLPFDTVHDSEELPCKESLGFLLQSGKDKILYLTDSAYCAYRFKGLTAIMIESNYQEELLQQNIEEGTVGYSLKARLLKTHLSLSNVIEFLKANDLSATREIYLMHLSSRNANPQQMKKVVEAEFGKPVFICGMADHVLEFGNGGIKIE